MRTVYLSPATSDRLGEADVVRYSSTAVVDVEIVDSDGADVARATGLYKVGELSADAPWEVDGFETG